MVSQRVGSTGSACYARDGGRRGAARLFARWSLNGVRGWLVGIGWASARCPPGLSVGSRGCKSPVCRRSVASPLLPSGQRCVAFETPQRAWILLVSPHNDHDPVLNVYAEPYRLPGAGPQVCSPGAPVTAAGNSVAQGRAPAVQLALPSRRWKNWMVACTAAGLIPTAVFGSTASSPSGRAR